MKYVDEFRNVEITKKILQKIHNNFSNKNINIMEVCGTHTMSIYKNGIDKLLPKNINLLSGPGCPVCVTDVSFIDTAMELSKNNKVIICTFSDILRVPGSNSSLNNEKAKGANIINIYSPLDCINIANNNKDKEVVFLGIGFETTIPIVGLTIKKAFENNIRNFSVLSAFKTMPNAIEKLIIDKETNVDGFICPGHVGSVIGNKIFDKLAIENNVPMAMAGFEHMDIVYAIYKLCVMIEKKEYRCNNEYKRIVRENGNKKAKDILEEVFQISDSTWRGLGHIENTGLEIKPRYKDYNSKNKFNIDIIERELINGCLCGQILKGLKKPYDCKLFNNKCTPENPVGACMVSSEGTCANYYKYR